MKEKKKHWLIASYPRSGNTWCRIFISEILRLKDYKNVNNGALILTNRNLDLNNDLKLDGINSAIDDSQNSNSLENLSEVIQNSGIENVSKNLELAFSNNKLGITEEISKSAEKISNALSKKSKNDKKVEDNTILQNVELPENISDTSVIVGAAVLSKPNLSSGVQGIVAPPEGLTSNSLISDDEIAISENLAEVDQTLITSNAMADTLGAMTKLKASELNELGIEKDQYKLACLLYTSDAADE